MELVIRLSFVKTLEFGGEGAPLLPFKWKHQGLSRKIEGSMI
jgi:hypothetical protein